MISTAVAVGVVDNMAPVEVVAGMAPVEVVADMAAADKNMPLVDMVLAVVGSQKVLMHLLDSFSLMMKMMSSLIVSSS